MSRRSMFQPPPQALPIIYPSEGVPAFTVEKPVESISDMNYRLNLIHDLYRERYQVESAPPCQLLLLSPFQST